MKFVQLSLASGKVCVLMNACAVCMCEGVLFVLVCMCTSIRVVWYMCRCKVCECVLCAGMRCVYE